MDLPTPEDLRERRDKLNLTQSDLAGRAEVSQPLIARIEGGDVDPRLSTLRRIVTALDEAEGGLLHAHELMNESVVSVEPDDSVNEALELMDEQGYSQLPVISQGAVEGLISTSSIRQQEGSNLGKLPVNEVMNESTTTVEPGETLADIESSLDHNDAVLVKDEGDVVGIITEADIARKKSEAE